MKTVPEYRHTETDHITCVSHVQTLRKNNTEQIAPTIELHLINAHAGFRHGKSFKSQLLNITRHTQDVYQESMITETGFR